MDGVVEQQVERYDAGVMLTYDRYHVEDKFGALTSGSLEAADWAEFEVDIVTFQREVDGQPFNGR